MKEKIALSNELSSKLDELCKDSKKVVFTNGCFDLLHTGHIEYLFAAKAMGDMLIIGVNDDASVKALKGESRPINNLQDRMMMLAALECTDLVVPFSEATPESLIKTIAPHVLVKGGDYTLDTIVGAEYVQQNGGEVKVIAFKEGYSSSAIISKIKNL